MYLIVPCVVTLAVLSLAASKVLGDPGVPNVAFLVCFVGFLLSLSILGMVIEMRKGK